MAEAHPESATRRRLRYAARPPADEGFRPPTVDEEPSVGLSALPGVEKTDGVYEDLAEAGVVHPPEEPSPA